MCSQATDFLTKNKFRDINKLNSVIQSLAQIKHENLTIYIYPYSIQILLDITDAIDFIFFSLSFPIHHLKILCN